MAQTTLPLSLKQSLEATKVSYTQLGKSGLRVSVPILGAMSFGHKDWQPWVIDDEAEVETLLKGAYDRGLNTWDTANVYSNGVSEELIGRVIKKYNLPRHKLVLLTKCNGVVPEEPGIFHIRYSEELAKSKDYVNQGGLSRTAIFNAVNASLKRLQTDYIDLLQIHVCSFVKHYVAASTPSPSFNYPDTYRLIEIRLHRTPRRNNEGAARPRPIRKSALHRRQLYVGL